MSAGEKYGAWISAYVASHDGFVRGRCSEATKEMVATFPELRRAAGFAHCDWGLDQHWWCVDPEGAVVDPTAAQFGALGVFEYEELDLNDPATRDRVPIGKCMNCGGPTFRSSPQSAACSVECEKDLDDEYGSGGEAGRGNPPTHGEALEVGERDGVGEGVPEAEELGGQRMSAECEWCGEGDFCGERCRAEWWAEDQKEEVKP